MTDSGILKMLRAEDMIRLRSLMFQNTVNPVKEEPTGIISLWKLERLYGLVRI